MSTIYTVHCTPAAVHIQGVPGCPALRKAARRPAHVGTCTTVAAALRFAREWAANASWLRMCKACERSAASRV